MIMRGEEIAIVLGLVLASLGPGHLVGAQTTNTTCTSTDETGWLFNTLGESPCLVWSKVQSLCLSSTDYINVPPLLDATWAYNPPGSAGTECQCNSVSYSLMAGCTWQVPPIPLSEESNLTSRCQLGSTGQWVSEQTYESGCDAWTEGDLGFAESVISIPPFALATWSGAEWDPSAAKTFAATYTVTSLPSYTQTLSRSFSPASTPTPTPSSIPSISQPSWASSAPSSSASVSASSGQGSGWDVSKWGPIVGGIAGGTLLLALVLALVLRHRRAQRQRQRQGSDSPETPSTLGEKAKLGKNSRSTLFRNSKAFFASRPAPTPSRQQQGRRHTGSEESFDARQATPRWTTERVLSSTGPQGAQLRASDLGTRHQGELVASPPAFTGVDFTMTPGGPFVVSPRQGDFAFQPPGVEEGFRVDPRFSNGAEIVTLSTLYQAPPLGLRQSTLRTEYEADDQYASQPGSALQSTMPPAEGAAVKDRLVRHASRPFSATAPTLPSLYEPATGAERWTLTDDKTPSRWTHLMVGGRDGRRTTGGAVSPASRYTQRMERDEAPDMPSDPD